MKNRIAVRTALAVVLAATMLAAGSLPAAAVDKRGSCTAGARWEMEAERDDGRIEFELEIDTRRAGKKWRVRIKQNGVLFYSRLRTTDRDGDIEVERGRPDRAGRDKFFFRAVQRSNGQVCKGTLRV